MGVVVVLVLCVLIISEAFGRGFPAVASGEVDVFALKVRVLLPPPPPVWKRARAAHKAGGAGCYGGRHAPNLAICDRRALVVRCITHARTHGRLMIPAPAPLPSTHAGTPALPCNPPRCNPPRHSTHTHTPHTPKTPLQVDAHLPEAFAVLGFAFYMQVGGGGPWGRGL